MGISASLNETILGCLFGLTLGIAAGGEPPQSPVSPATVLASGIMPVLLLADRLCSADCRHRRRHLDDWNDAPGLFLLPEVILRRRLFASVSTVVLSSLLAAASQFAFAQGGPIQKYGTPTNLAAVSGDVEALLTWTAAAGAPAGSGGYVVMRSTASGGPYVQVNSAPINGDAYIDTDNDRGLLTGTSYYYVVKYVDSSGVSGPLSAQASVTTLPEDGHWLISDTSTGKSSGQVDGATYHAFGVNNGMTITVGAGVYGPQPTYKAENSNASCSGQWTAVWMPNQPGSEPGLFVLHEVSSQSVDNEVTGHFSGGSAAAIVGGLSLSTADVHSVSVLSDSNRGQETAVETAAGNYDFTWTSSSHTVTMNQSADDGSVTGYEEYKKSAVDTLHVYPPSFFQKNFPSAGAIQVVVISPPASIAASADAAGGTTVGNGCSAGGVDSDICTLYMPGAE